MDRTAAITQIKDACNGMARELMKIHPAVPALAHADTQKEIYEAIYRLTKDVEVIKKQLLRLQKSDDSTLL